MSDCDVLVVGAGPAGAMAAHGLARRGARVLIVDRCAFPRDKVCGGCVNRAALLALKQAGLDDIPARLGARPLHSFHLYCRGRTWVQPLPGGLSVSRRALDAALVEAAVASGAEFRSRTTASPAPTGVLLRSADGQSVVDAGLVLAADGLGGSFMAGVPGNVVVARRSYMGAGTIVRHAPRAFGMGGIFMACAAGGYVGMVRLEDDSLNIAAALDPREVRSAGGPGALAQAILCEAGCDPLPGLGDLDWRGTPMLTRRRRRLGGHRMLVLGDAAGYVEPMTGEGIAWALASGHAVVPLALRALKRWDQRIIGQWTAWHRRALGRRLRWCRLVTSIARRPTMLCVVMALSDLLPRLLIQRINRGVACLKA